VVAGHSGQFTPGGYLSTVKHTALAGIEPTTFRLLVRRASTSCKAQTILKSLVETDETLFESYKLQRYLFISVTL